MNAKEIYASKPWLKYYPEGVPEPWTYPTYPFPTSLIR